MVAALSRRTADGSPGLRGAIVVAAFLALVSAMCFALAAALQQRGQFTLAQAGSAVEGLAGLFRLWWSRLAGGDAGPAGGLRDARRRPRSRQARGGPAAHGDDHRVGAATGVLVDKPACVRRQVLGAGVVVVGLAMFVLVGDPDAGVDDASALGLVTSVVVISAVVVLLMLWLRTATGPSVRAAVLGLCSGLLFGLLSPATGQLAPAMAAVSVANPANGVTPRDSPDQERLTRPGGTSWSPARRWWPRRAVPYSSPWPTAILNCRPADRHRRRSHGETLG